MSDASIRRGMMEHAESMARVLRVGDPVWYSPSYGGPEFSAVIDQDPRQLGDGTWVAYLRDLPEEYAVYCRRQRRTVPAAALSHMRRRPEEHRP